MYKIITTLNGYNEGEPIDAYQLNNIFNWFVASMNHCMTLNPDCEIHILTDLNLYSKFDDIHIHIHPLIKSIDVKFLKDNYIHLSPNPHHMEYNSMVRFIHLKDFCEKNNIDEFLYLEPDVLVFSNILEDKEYLKLKNYDITLMLERCAGVCFFNNGIKILNDITTYMKNSYSNPQIEPRAFDTDFYKQNAIDGYPHGGVSDMHFWKLYSDTHDGVFKNMDQNIDGIFWHTCVTRNMDDSDIGLMWWNNTLDSNIDQHIKVLKIENDKCYGMYNNNEVQIKYLHFNENTKKIIPKYTK